MKRLIIIVSCLILVSCNSNKLEEKYDPTSNKANLQDIEALVSKEDFKLLKEYIEEAENNDEDLSYKTYSLLLDDARTAHNEKIWKMEEEKRKEKERLKIEELTGLLCSKKWRKKEFAFQLEVPDDSEETIEEAKKILALTMNSVTIKGAKLTYVVDKNDKGIFVRVLYDDKTKKIFTRGYKKYSKDGSYVVVINGEEVEKGSWRFDGTDRILESSPSQSIIKPSHALEIYVLDENTFSYNDKEIDAINSETIVSVFTIMEH